ncbi:MAG TPA: DUF429 domain-containing protein [Candidatus Eisenbacteria bacterium]|nr:DUF429 domain-containing protein [Candidatus Eisenbacteria bacterium]
MHIGVDGCKAGWIAVTRGRDRLDYAVCASLRELISTFPRAERVVLDIPIGLPWKGAEIRPCDHLARSVLGSPRKSSVFPVPCREAAHAQSADQARALNLLVLERSLTAQTLSICRKIAEVDSLLRDPSGNGSHMREIHPEVCFWALAGFKPMRHRKTTNAGRRERLDVLERHEPGARALLTRILAERPRKQVKADDVLDALAAFVTAEARVGRLMRLVGEPSNDQAGLPMEMLYVELQTTPILSAGQIA